MAYSPVTRTVLNTDRRFVFSYNHISDGSNGGTTTIDASGLAANKLGQACTYLDIEKVRCNISTTAQNDSALVAFDADTDDTALLLNVEKDNSVDATTVATMEDDTFITVTWFVDPDRAAIYYSINNATPVKVAKTQLPDDEDITISFGIQNGEAAGNTLTIDYVNMIVER